MKKRRWPREIERGKREQSERLDRLHDEKGKRLMRGRRSSGRVSRAINSTYTYHPRSRSIRIRAAKNIEVKTLVELFWGSAGASACGTFCLFASSAPFKHSGCAGWVSARGCFHGMIPARFFDLARLEKLEPRIFASFFAPVYAHTLDGVLCTLKYNRSFYRGIWFTRGASERSLMCDAGSGYSSSLLGRSYSRNY